MKSAPETFGRRAGLCCNKNTRLSGAAPIYIEIGIDDNAGIVLEYIAGTRTAGQGNFPGQLNDLVYKTAFNPEFMVHPVAEQ